MKSKFISFINNHKYLVFIFELIVLCITFLLLYNKNPYSSVENGISISDWHSNYITYDEKEGWYIDSSMDGIDVSANGGTIDVIYGPFMTLPKGDYTVEIWYDCEINQSFTPIAGDFCEPYVKTGTGILDRNRNYVSYDFFTTEDLDNFEIYVKYNGEGSLRIHNIEIKSNNSLCKRAMVIVFAFFALADILWLSWPMISKRKYVFYALAGITFLVSLPLLAEGINEGHDINFHLMRIEGIAQELKYGQFPVKMASEWISGYGYPVSIYYGDIFLYIPALLRVAGFYIVSAYKLYILFANVLTVFLSYVCFKKMFRRSNIALLTTFVYCISSYRMMNVFIRAAVGEYTAMAFLPVIALALYNIYTEDCKNWKQYGKNSLILALGMTGIIQTHILSTEMVVFLMAIICLVFVKKTIRLNTIKVYVIAIVETVCINLGFLIPFLDYYLNVPVVINNPEIIERTTAIQNAGTYLFQFFSFFQNPYGQSTRVLSTRMAMTPGLLLMAALFLGIFLWVKKKADWKIKAMIFFSVLTLFISSNLFPWNYIGRHSQLGHMLVRVQFPWRYIGMATIFLSVLFGLVIKKFLEIYPIAKIKNFFLGIVVAGIYTVIVFFSQYSDGMVKTNYYDTPEINTVTAISGREYLPQQSILENIAYLGYAIRSENMEAPTLVSREGTKMVLHCKTDHTEGTVYVPMLNYKGYQATDDKGETFAITNGPNCEIAFQLPAGYEGTVTVEFVSPWYWHVAELISLVSVLVLILMYVVKNTLERRRRSRKENSMAIVNRQHKM